MEPKISIYTAVYNGEKFLSKTIESILNQSYSNWEYFIFDDGSTDSSREIIKKYAMKDNRIKYEYLENCGNPAILRNNGIKNATGEWLANCDQDDLWHHEKLEKQLSALEHHSENTNIGIICTNMKVIDKLNNEISGDIWIEEKLSNLTSFDPNSTYIDIPDYILILNNYVMLSSSLVKKEVYNDIGTLNENKKLLGMEDYEFWLRAACNNYEFRFVIEKLAYWRIHDNNLTKKVAHSITQANELIKLIDNALKCKKWSGISRLELSIRKNKLKINLLESNLRIKRNIKDNFLLFNRKILNKWLVFLTIMKKKIW